MMSAPRIAVDTVLPDRVGSISVSLEHPGLALSVGILACPVTPSMPLAVVLGATMDDPDITLIADWSDRSLLAVPSLPLGPAGLEHGSLSGGKMCFTKKDGFGGESGSTGVTVDLPEYCATEVMGSVVPHIPDPESAVHESARDCRYQPLDDGRLLRRPIGALVLNDESHDSDHSKHCPDDDLNVVRRCGPSHKQDANGYHNEQNTNQYPAHMCAPFARELSSFSRRPTQLPAVSARGIP